MSAYESSVGKNSTTPQGDNAASTGLGRGHFGHREMTLFSVQEVGVPCHDAPRRSVVYFSEDERVCDCPCLTPSHRSAHQHVV